MTTLSNLVQEKVSQQKNLFLPFIMAGHPGLDETLKLLEHLESTGVEVVELGIPYSDPTADGAVIRVAHELGLKAGTTLKAVLKTLELFNQKERSLKVILFTYCNPIMKYGEEQFLKDVEQSGVKGLLIVDLKPEYCSEYKNKLAKKDVEMIFLASPNTDQERLKYLAKETGAFLYYMSRKGVTGERQQLPKEIQSDLKAVQKLIEKPIMVGFGIKNHSEVQLINEACLGAVVGSALVKHQADFEKFSGLLSELFKGE